MNATGTDSWDAISAALSPEHFAHAAKVVLHELSCSKVNALDASFVPLLLGSMASALEAADSLLRILPDDDPAQSGAMQSSIDLLAGMTAWLVQEGGDMQQMGLDLLCSPLTQVMDRALLLSHAALFSLRWYTAMGVEIFQNSSSTIRSVVKDIALLALGFISIWSDLQADDEQHNFQLCKSFATTLVKRLLDLGVTSADAVVSSRSDLPQEMVSLVTVNVSWNGLSKIMLCLSTSHQLPLIDAGLAIQIIEHTLDYLGQWLQHFIRPPHDVNKLKVVKYWTMHLTKLIGTYVSCASQCWPRLASISLCCYHFIARSATALMQDEEIIRADLEQHIAPKLSQLLMMFLEEEAQEGGVKAAAGLEAVVDKLQLLSHGLHGTMHQPASGNEPEPPPQQLLPGRLLLVAAMLSRAPLLSSSMGLLAMARHLLPWAFSAAAVQAYPTTSPQCHAVEGTMGLVSSGALALVSACSSFACTHDDATALEAWKVCLTHLYKMACDVHPALQHLASTTLTCFVAAASPPVAAQQLGQLGGLVADFAAAEAVAQSGCWVAAGSGGMELEAAEGVFAVGPASCTSSAACRVAHLLRTVLKAVPESTVSTVYQELHLDAGNCDVATLHLASSLATALLLGSFFHSTPCTMTSEAVPWLTALVRRTNQLHEIVQGTRRGPQEAAVVASLHLAAVLMAVDSSVRQAQQLMQEGSDAAGRAVAHAAASAAEILLAWTPPQPAALAAPQASPPPPCHVAWALRVVSRAGSSLSAEALGSLLPALMLLLDSPSCSVHVAAAAAHYSAVEPLPAVLFHGLLHKGHWALQHEALLSLVRVSRVSTAGDFRALIPKDLFAPSSAAQGGCSEGEGGLPPPPPQPQVFKLGKAYKEYLERRPAPEKLEAPLQAWREAEGQALQGLADSARQPPGADAPGAAAALVSRLPAGFGVLARCASSVSNVAPSSSAGPQQQPLLAQLVVDGKAKLAATAQAVAALETSLLSLQSAVRSGAAFSGVNPGDARAQLHSHTLYLLGELASAGSKMRSLQEVIQTLR